MLANATKSAHPKVNQVSLSVMPGSHEHVDQCTAVGTNLMSLREMVGLLLLCTVVVARGISFSPVGYKKYPVDI